MRACVYFPPQEAPKRTEKGGGANVSRMMRFFPSLAQITCSLSLSLRAPTLQGAMNRGEEHPRGHAMRPTSTTSHPREVVFGQQSVREAKKSEHRRPL